MNLPNQTLAHSQALFSGIPREGMGGLQKLIGSVHRDPNSGTATSSLEALKNGGSGVSTSLSSSDQSRVLLTRPPRQVISLWTCSKLCVICFAAGVVVGFTLKRRVRRWASKLLKKLKDD